jgi:hypothetical protein
MAWCQREYLLEVLPAGIRAMAEVKQVFDLKVC